MREGSTLIHDLLPDTRGCELGQPLDLPKGSALDTAYRMGLLVFVTLAFDMFLDNIAVFAFVMMISLRWVRLTAGLLVCLFIHRNVPSILITPVALGLLLYQSVLLTKHWVYLSTATCRPRVALDIRARLGPSLTKALIFLPLSLVWGAFCLIRDGDDAWRAWVSYLNYGREGVRAPGAFHSPAGDYAYRIHLFYVVGAAVTLALVAMPVPFLGILLLDPVTIALLSALCVVPALICVVVPVLILAPHLGNLRRIHRGTDL